MTLSAVILAAGQSRRMGRDKAWLELDGMGLIVRAVSMLRELSLEEIFISGRLGVDYSSLRCPVLFDIQPECGPVGGIERGLSAARSPLVLVLAVDLPRMSSDFVRRLHEHCGEACGALPILNGRSEPLAAIYPKHCHATAANFLAAENRSARQFADACLEQNAVRKFPVDPADALCFENWNRPSDIGELGRS